MKENTLFYSFVIKKKRTFAPRKQNITMELNKYFKNSESVEMMRSEMHPASYNPRKISDEGKRALKRSIKQFGVVGGIVVNKQTDNTIVGGHQKILILDEINKYDETTKENDYAMRVELIDVDEKTEKTLNLALNNGNVGGSFDLDMLREMIPEIDYKDAGFTEADLSMIGVDYLFKTEDETDLANELDDMMTQVNEDHRQEVEARKEQRQAAKEAERAIMDYDDDANDNTPKTYEEKTQHMKDVKQQVKDAAIEKAANMEAYLMLSFDNWEAKSAFCNKFGFDPTIKFIKGEDLDQRIDGYGEFGDEDYEE